MKLDRLNYLELIVHHKDFTLYEYPSRYCVLRIPLEKINSKDIHSVILSLGQVRKLFKIGFFVSPNSYIVVGHRSFDIQLITKSPGFHDRFCVEALAAKVYFSDYL